MKTDIEFSSPRIKSWILLFVFSFSLVPLHVGQAETPDRTFEEARYLFYLGDAFLEDEANLDTAVKYPQLMAPALGVQRAEGAEEVMDRMIHAAKQERNDLDANCRELQRRYESAGVRMQFRSWQLIAKVNISA